MKRYAVFNKEGNRMFQYPTYADLITASIALERFQERKPEAGFYLDEIKI